MSNKFKSLKPNMQTKFLKELIPEYHHGKISLRQLSEKLDMSVIEVIDLLHEFD